MRTTSAPRRQGFGLQPLQRKALGDDVYSVLRKMIVHRELEPGSKIVEAQIASLLGVSRTPVREALQRLEYEGWVENQLGRSPRVTPMTSGKVEEIYPLIAVLEGLAVRLAMPHLTAADLQHMKELTNTMASCARRGDVEKLLEADTRFHGLLHERSQNHRLRRFIGDLRGRTERFEHAYFSTPAAIRGSLRRHRKLVRLLEKENAQAAQRALEKQWDVGRRELLEIVRQEQMVKEAPGRPASPKGRPHAGPVKQVRRRSSVSRNLTQRKMKNARSVRAQGRG